MRRFRPAWVATVLFSISLVSTPARPWQQQVPQPPVMPGEVAPADPDAERMQRQQEKRMNKDRQESLKRDTEKLLKLATELKEYVDKTNENVLSLDVVNKAEEIEKLAKKVHDKMKG